MDLLERVPLPRRLAARVWLLTVPSAVISFERRQHIPGLPLGRGRFLGLALIAAGLFTVLRPQPAPLAPGGPPHGLSRFLEKPAVAGGLLALAGVALLVRSLMLTAYVLGLAFAFARASVDLEEPRVPRGGPADEGWQYDETEV